MFGWKKKTRSNERTTYNDANGYFRYKDTDRLVHRDVAYKYLFEPNQSKMPHRFSSYQVHHIDRNKTNNHPSNLQLVTVHEHREEHGLPPLTFMESFIHNLSFGDIKGYITIIMIIIMIITFLFS
tara:strand:+ start:8041 stop:8415 length:375 start_codon:yes stop_codon:yes gene_type:complete